MRDGGRQLRYAISVASRLGVAEGQAAGPPSSLPGRSFGVLVACGGERHVASVVLEQAAADSLIDERYDDVDANPAVVRDLLHGGHAGRGSGVARRCARRARSPTIQAALRITAGRSHCSMRSCAMYASSARPR